MADVDIDPFKEHDETDNYADEPAGKIIPPTLFTPGGGPTWAPEHKRSSETMSKRYIEQKHFISTISNSEMGNCATKAKACP